MTTRARLIVFSLPVALAASPANAQMPTLPTPAGQQPGQPVGARPATGQAPRPIFGGGVARIAQSLTLGLSIGETFFRTESDASAARPSSRDDSAFVYGSGSVAYLAEGTRAGASIALGSTGQYFSELSDEVFRGYGGQAGGWVRFSARTRLTADQGVMYQPAFQGAFRHLMDPTGGLVNDPTTDVSASDERWLSYDSRVTLSHMFSRRATLSVDYARRHIDYRSSDIEQLQQQAGVRYVYQLGAGLGLRAGYRYSTGRTGGSNPEDRRDPVLHTIDAGVDFNRALSVSRRTTLNIQTGSALVTDSGGTTFFVVGTGTLAHQMLRTWTATVSAGRTVDFADGFRDPVVSDRALASVIGTLSRRVQVNTFVTAVRGREATGNDGDAFVTYLGGAGIAVGLMRSLTWTTSHVRQQSDFGGVAFLVSPQLRSFDSTSTGLTIGLGRYLSLHTTYAYSHVDRSVNDPTSPAFRRQSIAVSVSTSLPLFATVRK